MNTDLPIDLIEFLQAGRQLEYDVTDSEVGQITLKNESDLSLTTIETFPGCQSIIEDPYSDLDGVYQCEVYDIVAESEDYDPEGLLCWIVVLKRFGCIDSEHGDVITFPDVTWTDIATNPLPYLDAQWREHDVAFRVLPWMHFPFELPEIDAVIMPYGSRCPVHDVPVTLRRARKPLLFEPMRRREMDQWLTNYHTTFPCSGVPVADDELLCCPECRAAEDTWMQAVVDSVLPADATATAHGWVKCPDCGITFPTSDPNMFMDSIHLICGQKINVVTSR